MTRLRYCSLLTSWSLAPMVKAWRGPSRLPLAWFTLALATAIRTSSRVSALAASRAGFTWMRIAGFWPPLRVTRPTPGELGDLRHQACVREVLDARQGQGGRGETQGQDRRVGRVHLAVDRRVGEIGGQKGGGRVDRGLHLLLRDIERQVQVELQRDHAAGGRAGRRHLLEPGHLAELALERGGDRGGHDVGARPGVEGLYLHGRVVDLGQGGDREQPVGDEAGQDDRDGEEGGGDRP